MGYQVGGSHPLWHSPMTIRSSTFPFLPGQSLLAVVAKSKSFTFPALQCKSLDSLCCPFLKEELRGKCKSYIDFHTIRSDV